MGLGVVFATTDPRLPGNDRGYTPVQPIAFSHRVHAGELAIDCQYCHSGARRSRHAGVPATSICMNCHAVVRAAFDDVLTEKQSAAAEGREPKDVVSTELLKLYTALGLDEKLEPVAGATPRPVEWVRVHDLPDFAYFDHRPHVARNIACETCHGPVQTMERMQQFSDLSMGWCIDCHRSNAISGGGFVDAGPRAADHVSTDCVTCHL
ncbi:MAG: hypothetical protein H6831_09010 [Planctomycetes bacterium]|nr:hypothetical protein [Planctomycetota bacterium]MCB9904531.1 hypothetical protein [Planctomycetota bacterium]